MIKPKQKMYVQGSTAYIKCDGGGRLKNMGIGDKKWEGLAKISILPHFGIVNVLALWYDIAMS